MRLIVFLLLLLAPTGASSGRSLAPSLLVTTSALSYSSYRPSSRSLPPSTNTATTERQEDVTSEYSAVTTSEYPAATTSEYPAVTTSDPSAVRLSATSAHYPPGYAEDEVDGEQAALPEKSDTAIVQNNYNVKMSTTRAGVTRSDSILWTIIIGLLVVILVMGVILLATIWKLVATMSDDGDKRHHPMIVMPPPPGANIKWSHDPIYEMPQGYPTGGDGPDDQRHFRDNELHPPKYE